jgi:DNA-binding response OmpR family regulator
MDNLHALLPVPPPTADRPLSGLTILLVEDSRLACEGMRLLCRRSGARLRRADSLQAADRHLRSYRPGAIVVDLHLPDGSGLGLIRALAAARPRIDAILATSGDPQMQASALTVGADAFLPKPSTLADLQAAILGHLPPDGRPGVIPLPLAPIPDPDALREDLAHAAALLAQKDQSLDYVAAFLRGVARSAGDSVLEQAARDAPRHGPAALAQLLRTRLAA